MAVGGKILLENLEILRETLDYSEDCGEFTWRVVVGKSIKAGSKAGYIQKKSESAKYVLIRFHGKNYPAHQLAWFYVYGRVPNGILDHIDGDGTNNRISNLRDVDNATNSKNMSMSGRNTSGCVGVSYCKKSGKWHSTICVDGKSIFLGSFYDLGVAVEIRQSANVQYGFHFNHGKLKPSVELAQKQLQEYKEMK